MIDNTRLKELVGEEQHRELITSMVKDYLWSNPTHEHQPHYIGFLRDLGLIRIEELDPFMVEETTSTIKPFSVDNDGPEESQN